MLCRVVAVLVSCVVAEVAWAAPPSIILPELADYACASSISQVDLLEQFQIHGVQGGTARLGKFNKLQLLLQQQGLSAERASEIDKFIRLTVKQVSGGKAGGGPLLDVLTLFEQKLADREINVVLLSDHVTIAEPINNAFLDRQELGAKRWVLILPSRVWQDEVLFAEEVVMGLAPAAGVQFLLKWRDACKHIVKNDRKPVAPLFGLFFDEKKDQFKRPSISAVGIMYNHLVQHQLIKRNSPEDLAAFRAVASNAMSFALLEMAERNNSNPAISSWLRASFRQDSAFWDVTIDTLNELNQSIVRVALRGN